MVAAIHFNRFCHYPANDKDALANELNGEFLQ